MSVLNLRLGQWVPNPAGAHSRWWSRPTAMILLLDIARGFMRENRALCLLTDGGHHENLGMGQLIRRRCAVLIVSDAGQDGDRDFTDLARLYRRARLEGVRILERDGKASFSLQSLSLIEPRKQVAEKQYMLGRVKYPDGQTALLVYIKPALRKVEELDLERHSKGYSSFPHDPTSDVAYDEDRVESYRQLGYSIGSRVCDELESLQQSLKKTEHPEEDAGEAAPTALNFITLARLQVLMDQEKNVEEVNPTNGLRGGSQVQNTTVFVSSEAVPPDDTPIS